MNVDGAKRYCLLKPGAYEDYPFDSVTPVIKSGSKMFALFNEHSISLKCDPLLSGNLRRQYSAITPGGKFLPPDAFYLSVVILSFTPEYPFMSDFFAL
jgi:predicted DNA-binding protein (MmcQ/YjbR family)